MCVVFRLQEMEDKFYTYVSSNEVATELDINPRYCELLYNYWKLKRKVTPDHLCCNRSGHVFFIKFRPITIIRCYLPLMLKILLKKLKKN